MNKRMPVIFSGHGSPMNAVEDNRWSRGFAALAEHAPQPSAILVISAHWYVDGTFVTANTQPETIHDFSGFPPELYAIDYPAPGAPELAQQVCELIGLARATTSTEWGLDHGTWSVLRWMYPAADIPVLQVSMDRRLETAQHHAIGRSLLPLRDEGVLILGSGNVVHNLRDAFQQMRAGTATTPEWAQHFDTAVAQALREHDTETLLKLWPETDDGRMAHPTPDHWLPLIYAAAASDADDRVQFPVEGFDWGSLSMRAVVFG
jgi:4,5-DOPA dioxygenase extradiol